MNVTNILSTVYLHKAELQSTGLCRVCTEAGRLAHPAAAFGYPVFSDMGKGSGFSLYWSAVTPRLSVRLCVQCLSTARRVSDSKHMMWINCCQALHALDFFTHFMGLAVMATPYLFSLMFEIHVSIQLL